MLFSMLLASWSDLFTFLGGRDSVKSIASPLNNERGNVRNSCPPLGRFGCHGPPDVRAFEFPLRGYYYSSIVLEADPRTANPAHRILLPHDHCVEYLLFQVGWTLLHHGYNHVPDTRGWHPLQPAFKPSNLNDPERLCARIVRTVNHRIEWYGLCYVGLELLNALGGNGSRFC